MRSTSRINNAEAKELDEVDQALQELEKAISKINQKVVTQIKTRVLIANPLVAIPAGLMKWEKEALGKGDEALKERVAELQLAFQKALTTVSQEAAAASDKEGMKIIRAVVETQIKRFTLIHQRVISESPLPALMSVQVAMPLSADFVWMQAVQQGPQDKVQGRNDDPEVMKIKQEVLERVLSYAPLWDKAKTKTGKKWALKEALAGPLSRLANLEGEPIVDREQLRSVVLPIKEAFNRFVSQVNAEGNNLLFRAEKTARKIRDKYTKEVGVDQRTDSEFFAAILNESPRMTLAQMADNDQGKKVFAQHMSEREQEIKMSDEVRAALELVLSRVLVYGAEDNLLRGAKKEMGNKSLLRGELEREANKIIAGEVTDLAILKAVVTNINKAFESFADKIQPRLKDSAPSINPFELFGKSARRPDENSINVYRRWAEGGDKLFFESLAKAMQSPQQLQAYLNSDPKKISNRSW